MKKWWVATVGASALALVLSGCTPEKKEVVQKEEKQKEETVYIPELQINDEFYRVLLPYKPSSARGLIVNNIYTKYDMKEVEEGLLRISTNYFSPDNYYFQDGQYLERETIRDWLRRQNKNKKGLNPALPSGKKEEEHPMYLAHIQEQNFLTKKNDKTVSLEGISIGLALNSVYYSPEGEEVDIPDATLREEGKKIADEVVKRMRTELKVPDVPIAVSLFKQERRNAIVPGTYMLTGIANKGKTTVGSWKNIDESYVLLPAKDDEEEKYKELSNQFLRFKNEVSEFFPNFVSVIGYGHYQNGGVKAIQIEVPVEFFGTSELIGFTQQMTTLTMKYFSSMNVEVSITSVNGPEALIVKKVDDEKPFVHVYSY